jgi:hypothetical protein
MKDSIVALTEAVRLARLELECYRDPTCRASPEWTLNRLDTLLHDSAVNLAMSVLFPELEGPPLVPQKTDEISEAPSSYSTRSHSSVMD